MKNDILSLLRFEYSDRGEFKDNQVTPSYLFYCLWYLLVDRFCCRDKDKTRFTGAEPVCTGNLCNNFQISSLTCTQTRMYLEHGT